MGKGTVKGSAKFTPREGDALQLAAKGLLNKEIARKLAVTESAVEKFLSSVYSKIDVENRTEAAKWHWEHEHEPWLKLASAITAEHFRPLVKQAYQKRIKGDTRETIRFCKTAVSLIDVVEPIVRRVSDAEWAEFLEVKALLLHEMWVAYREILTSNKVEWTKTIAVRQEEIAKTLGDKNLIGLTCWDWGDTFNIAGRPAEAMKKLDEASEQIGDPDYALDLARTRQVVLSRLGESGKSKAEWVKTEGMIKDGNWSDPERICQTFEGAAQGSCILARGQPILNSNSKKYGDVTFERLESGWNVWREKMATRRPKATFRYIQLSSTGLFAIVTFKTKGMRQFITDGENALQIAQDNKLWRRHKKRMEANLDELPG